MNKPYYLAYEERYKKVHSMNIAWFGSRPTLEVLKWVEEYQIPGNEVILEVGCGEGRDLIYLAGLGYRVKGVDISPTAIQYCKKLARKREVEIDLLVCDGLYLVDELGAETFNWIYSVGTLHMLVDQNHRDRFLKNIYQILKPGGKALLVNMGDGKEEYITDKTKAFEEEERNHPDGVIRVASTSCRKVNWDYHLRELKKAGFTVEKQLSTENEEYGKCMTVYLTKES
ncbi:hypothetical protein BBF96_01070 [Anoxybacter fermentans]|uniref:Methyltransferase domain-containing protein n=1 Tax=Anoxybacter fermentans TaxID=1323375 RepID=A0A3S9SUZ8_9FIRM|nr:class I SAM-dependent methyltransferase [Anoxybacter fermentans]AZR72105.1 hypothetical protein BBF96_01070 [Anoxybacter fermentans]